MNRLGVLTSKDLWDAAPTSTVRVAGVVTHRQRPMTAQGTTFLNLEDEFGLINVVVSKGCWARFRKVARAAPAMLIRGRLERSEGVINIVADHLAPLPVPGRTRAATSADNVRWCLAPTNMPGTDNTHRAREMTTRSVGTLGFGGQQRGDLAAVADDLDEHEAVGRLDDAFGAGDTTPDVAGERVEERVDAGAVERPVDRDRVGLVQIEQRRTRDSGGIARAMTTECEKPAERSRLTFPTVHDGNAGCESAQVLTSDRDGRRVGQISLGQHQQIGLGDLAIDMGPNPLRHRVVDELIDGGDDDHTVEHEPGR